MKIYLAQFNPTVGDLEGNAKKIHEISLHAFKKSAEFLDALSEISKILSALPSRSPTVGFNCARYIFIILFSYINYTNYFFQL